MECGVPRRPFAAEYERIHSLEEYTHRITLDLQTAIKAVSRIYSAFGLCML